jgi:hypothetical protein
MDWKVDKFLTEDEILQDLINNQDSRIIIENSKSDLIMLHHSLGRTIRNDYRLWHEDNPINHKGNYEWDSEHHPDQISQRIIEKLYEYWVNKKV